MTAADSAHAGRAGSGGHRAWVIPVVSDDRELYRASCSCGWNRPEVNTKRENALRAARRHAQEARE